MKKSKFLLAVISTVALTGCSIEDLMFWKKKDDSTPTPTKKYDYIVEMEGGSDAEQDAILQAINKKPVCIGSKTGSDIYPDGKTILTEDNGDGIKLTTIQKVKTYTVNLTWEVNQAQDYFLSFSDSDESHKIIQVKYQGFGKPDGSISWSLAKATCGEAKTTKALAYSASTKNETFKHDTVKISEIYSITDQEKTVTVKGEDYKFASTFDNVDYTYDGTSTSYSPYFATNNPEATEKQYLYYNVYGKLIYSSPDGNWGLIADGDDVLELYEGKAYDLLPSKYPSMSNEYVLVSGNMSQYKGNVQLGYVTKINPATADDVTEPTLNYANLSKEDIASLNVDGYTCQKQAVVLGDGSCLSNSLKSVTGTIVPNSIRMETTIDDEVVEQEKTVDDIRAAKRFTFQVKVGGEEGEVITVAYDYHTDKTGSVGIFNKLKEKLTAGGAITIKGTMRYNGNDSLPFITKGNNGVWNIVPFLADHVA